MLKLKVQNKVLDDGAEVLHGYFESDERPVSRGMLIQTRERLLHEAAREHDTSKRNEITIQISKIDAAIANFDAVAKAEYEVASRRLDYLQEQQSHASREANEFADACACIASAMLRRYIGVSLFDTSFNPTFGTDSEESKFRRYYAEYFKHIFDNMTTEQAREQEREILEAVGNHRQNWRELSFTPRPPFKKAVMNPAPYLQEAANAQNA